MLSPNVRRAGKKEIPFLASFLAGIFFDNVVYAGIFPARETRKKRLEWLFEKNLLLQHATKNAWVMLAENTGEITDVKDIIATVTFLPSAEKRSTIADYVQKGLLTMPLKFGFKAFKNLLRANKHNEYGIRQIPVDQPFWYLGMVAVAADHRKKGIAGQLINEVIRHNASAQTFHNGDTSILLTTQLEFNVSLYNKLGFITIHTNIQDNYTIWTMKKL